MEYYVDLTPSPSPKERGAGTRTSAQATPLLRRGAGGEVYVIYYFVDFHLITKTTIFLIN
jgi:hypothetical protein